MEGDGGTCAIPGCGGGQCCTAERVCQSVICEGKEFVCAVGATGYTWAPGGGKKVVCDDGDPCTGDDQCVSNACLGAPLACDTPPPTSCVDKTTLRAYSAQGSCKSGICEYPSTDTTCPAPGCDGAQCTGNPCLGIKCDKPPSSCHANPGTCANGQCTYQKLPTGSPCSTGSSCQTGGTCDDQGVCTGTGLTCNASNATGSCVNGACQFTCSGGFANCNNNWADGCEANLTQNGNCGSCGKSCTAANAAGSCAAGSCQFTCSAGYGNCNNNWSDGCEVSLTSTSNCGTCGKTCTASPHTTASCSGGACKLTCVSPWQACDGNAGDSDGCEIPVGQANHCNKSGLKSGACGTPWCGSSSKSGAANFGTWTCVFCSHCHHYSNGYAWCLFNPGSGEFSSDRCSSCCNSSLTDLVCSK